MSSEYIRFMISGLIGTALFYVVYEGIHRFLHLSPALCWFFAYLLSILWQMELHARIVYKTKINNYAATLVQTYLAYGLSIVLSTVLDWFLVEKIHMDHQIAYAVTLILTGFINYFTVSKIMKADSKPKL